jgi:hypothetical protein
MLIKHVRDEPKPPSHYTELEIPPELDRIVLECLSKDPEGRPASTDDLTAQLLFLDKSNEWTTDEANRWWEQHRPRQVSE